MFKIKNSIQEKPEFSVRIVVCDSYLTKPIPGFDVVYSKFRGSDISKVPVLRIFGSATDGYKVCLHIHGVFPYFYIPCPTPNPEPQFLYQVATSLDKAINIALKQAMSTNQHVYNISLVKGLPFYGYHDKDHLYLKVFLYNPGLIKQAVELVSNGAILGQPFQPHESHLNFTLQFFIDFNLFGMSNIDLQNVKFRKSGISQKSDDPLQSSDGGILKPESLCYYEADCVASDILNRQRIGSGDGIENPGLEEVWNQEKERRKLLNMSMASKSLSQGRLNSDETNSHHKFNNMFISQLLNFSDKPVTISSVIISEESGIHYPAESLKGSELLNAVEVSMHLPENSSLTLNSSLSFCNQEDTVINNSFSTTLVDENVAMNSSLSVHYSQINLESQDLELLNLLEDMDDKTEKDSIMCTPAATELDGEVDSDDEEYSQIFNDNTVLIENVESKDIDEMENTSSWNDSFWEGANIPQLDGTYDDDHVKKVRKRKMRPFKLGLSRPKPKSQKTLKKENSDVKDESTETDVINESKDTIDVSRFPLKKVKLEVQSVDNLSITEMVNEICNNVTEDKLGKAEIYNINKVKHEVQKSVDNLSITDMVNEICDNVMEDKLGKAEIYDIKNEFIPVAGVSSNVDVYTKKCEGKFIIDSQNTSIDSTPDDKNTGILSFYDMSKVFDMSLDEKDPDEFTKHNLMDDVTDTPASPSILENIVFEQSEPVEKKNLISEHVILTPKIKPPTRNYVLSTLENYNLPKVNNPKPFYSLYKDVGDQIEVGQKVLKIVSKSSADQKPYEKVLNTTTIEEWRQLIFLQNNDTTKESSKPEYLKVILASNRQCILEPIKRPPLKSEVVRWHKELDTNVKSDVIKNEICINNEDLDNSQALGLHEEQINNSISLENEDKDKTSLDSTMQVSMQPDGSFLCFGGSDNKARENSEKDATIEVDFLTVMLLEVHASVRGDLHPDPSQDAIQAVFFMVTNDCPPGHFLKKSFIEIFVVGNDCNAKLLDRCIFDYNVTYVSDEIALLESIIQFIKTHDPDIMCGYEIEMSSWGYVLERSQNLGMEMLTEISRITEKHRQKKWRNDENDFEGKILGRITFNVWRLFRHELALSSYTFENCMWEILKERVPQYSYSQLSKWWSEESKITRWITVEYFLTKVTGTVRMLQKLDIINRTSELARLFGLQWWEVLSRGSQFRVESLMLRAARPLNLVALSPSVSQRAAMKAPECLPLIFEPESRHYSDPVIVLDFQSLYPSMMIAYNYCFSTCIGRVQNINGESAYEFGAWRLRIPRTKLEHLSRKGLIHWSPVGVGFVKSSVRRGVLPALLRRILAARQAVKKGMKLQTDESVKKAMHSRQLGLKLIANVTYGYTAANFSGRMPCVELGDSVVAKGRETLERAIELVNKNDRWNVKVVYGDTDSMFVLVPGANREEAFKIGQEIADAVTADNPSPVALKLEKVYQPCILQTKKRYVGFMYESADQKTPVYEAKGIETVRRDGCPAASILLRESLCELFSTGDMSNVKRHVVALLSRIADGTIPVHQLFFTREYKGVHGYKAGAAAPPNEIAKRVSARDPRARPRTGWRVSWLVCSGAHGIALSRLARSSEEVAQQPTLTAHAAYYIARAVLPPLHRCFALVGVDVHKWWSEAERQRVRGERLCAGEIARFLGRRRCAICHALATRSICDNCAGKNMKSTAVLGVRIHKAATYNKSCTEICRSCTGNSRTDACVNTECPVFWRLITARQSINHLQDIIDNLPQKYAKEPLQF